MKFARDFLANALVGGLLVVVPIYLAMLVRVQQHANKGRMASARAA